VGLIILMTRSARPRILVGCWLFCALMMSTIRTRQTVGDWSFAAAAGKTLGTARWAHAYVDHPSVQTGPATIALAWLLGPGATAIRLAILLCGLTVLAVLAWMARDEPSGGWRLVIGGTIVAVWWPQLAIFGHLDDALVIVLAVVAVECARRGRSVLTATLGGIAIAFKPTGVFMLALAIPRGGCRSLKSWMPLSIGVAIGSLPWLPFVIVVPETVRASRSVAAVSSDSVLSLFMTVGTQPTGGYRALQLLLMHSASGLAMVRVGPAAVLATGVAVRMLLDPVTWPYYTPALVVGTLVWEICETHRRVPWMTVGVAVLLPTPAVLENADARLWLRLLAGVGVIAVMFVVARRAQSTIRVRASSCS
jgi:hypothetical protein